MRWLIKIGLLALVGSVSAMTQVVDIFLVNNNQAGIGEKIGTLTLEDSQQGLVITPQLQGLAPGAHGFHIHEYPSCEAKEKDNQWQAALGAGGHFDPTHSEKHLGPKGSGHLGDLPLLMVNEQGLANSVLIASRLTLNAIQNRAVVIHAGGDNYLDEPKPLGGGGARVACGVISSYK